MVAWSRPCRCATAPVQAQSLLDKPDHTRIKFCSTRHRASRCGRISAPTALLSIALTHRLDGSSRISHQERRSRQALGHGTWRGIRRPVASAERTEYDSDDDDV
jgi:hypothetical protein